MSLAQRLKQLDAKLDKRLHDVEDLLGEPVYFYLATIADAMYYQPEMDRGDISKAAIKCAVSRARDEEGRLVWPTEKDRSAMLKESHGLDFLKDVGAKILNYERELFGGDDFYKDALKN